MQVFDKPPKKLAAVYERANVKNSLAVEHNGVLYLSGIGPVDPFPEYLAGDIRHQARETLATIQEILEGAGVTLDHVLKMTVYLTDSKGDFEGWNEVFLEVFEPPYPCRVTVGSELILGRIEIEATASATEPRR